MPNLKLQTYWYRSPELYDGSEAYTSAIDMWSLGIVLAEVCGQTFFKVAEDGLQSAYASDGFLRLSSPWTWPAEVRQLGGQGGQDLLSGLLCFKADDRLSAGQVVRHAFVCPTRFAVVGTSPVHAGERNEWSILAGTMAVEVLDWLRGDLRTSSGLDIDFKSARGRKNVKVEKGWKWILGGKMVHSVASGSMCKLNLDELLPLPRVRAFWEAFKKVNHATFQALHSAAREAANFEANGKQRNRYHFLEHTFDQWFCNAAELAVTENLGHRPEPVHMDGGASILHAGITLYGHRCLTCQRPGYVPLDVHNHPGTVYMGVLTGPRHQVKHQHSEADDLLDGKYSVSVMLRTTLFPHDRSRGKETTPAPTDLYYELAGLFTRMLVERPFRLPSLLECWPHLDGGHTCTSPVELTSKRAAGKSQVGSNKKRR